MIKTFRFLGWEIAIGNEPMKVIKRTAKSRSRARDICRDRRLKIAGNRCEICGKPIDKRCSLHHLLNVGEPDRNAVENVMVLCPACHQELMKRPHYHGIKHLESFDEQRYANEKLNEEKERIQSNKT